MSTLPALNMADWTIRDYGLAFEGIRQVNYASLWLQNQPRAAKGHHLYPGGDFIASIGEDWCNGVLSDLVDSLRAIRFADTAQDERRLLLLLQDEASWGPASEPLANILAVIAEQKKKAA